MGVELEAAGHVLEWQPGASVDDILARDGHFDVLVLRVELSLDLSRRDDLQFLAELRRRGYSTPIVAVCSGSSRGCMLGSLDCGANDFIVRPFRPGELTARLQAAARRIPAQAASLVVTHGDIRVDRSARQVTLAGQPVSLQSREFTLLLYLLENRGHLRSKSELEESLYEKDSGIDSNAIEVHVHNLRRKLGKDLIRTVHGQGYVIDSPG